MNGLVCGDDSWLKKFRCIQKRPKVDQLLKTDSKSRFFQRSVNYCLLVCIVQHEIMVATSLSYTCFFETTAIATRDHHREV